METRRRRKHPRIEVTGHIQLEVTLAPWELELLRAAFSRLAASPQPEAAEAPDATH